MQIIIILVHLFHKSNCNLWSAIIMEQISEKNYICLELNKHKMMHCHYIAYVFFSNVENMYFSILYMELFMQRSCSSAQ